MSTSTSSCGSARSATRSASRSDSDLDSAGGDVSRLFTAASRLLSQLSGEVGFVVAPDALHTVVKSLRFLAVAPGKILCVQVNEPDVVISRVLETEADLLAGRARMPSPNG